MKMKIWPGNKIFADGSVGARVRLMVRGGCLPVRGSERMAWKYDDDCCGCGQVETDEHVLFERIRTSKMERNDKKEDGMHEYDVIKGYELENAEIEKETMNFFRVMWINRQRDARMREYGLV